MMKHVIRIVEETRKGILESKPRYNVLLNGEKVGQLYFNMRGYTGCYLPQHNKPPLHVGEVGIRAYRKAAAEINRAALRSA